MLIFIIRRVLQAIPVVFLASIGVFLLLHQHLGQMDVGPHVVGIDLEHA